MECKLHEIIKLGDQPGSGNLILGEILMFHVANSITDLEGNIDTTKIDHVARNGGPWYSLTKDSLFKLNKPNGLGIGFDSLPDELIYSELKGSELAKLASINEIPSLVDKKDSLDIDLDILIIKISKCLSNDAIIEAWSLFLNWKKKNE